MMALRGMTPQERADWVPRQITEFAEQMILASAWPREDALDRSLAAHEALFAPMPGHDFLRASQDDITIGHAWIGPPPAVARGPFGWLYQITVEEGQRGRGHGRRLLAALERRAARRWNELRLNVFSWNDPAIRLYESAGWVRVATFETSAHYAKRLR